MTNTLSEQLRTEAAQLSAWASKLHDPEIETPLKRLEQAAAKIGVAWSGSSISYHSRVYYEDFQRPPAGAHFSTEWGFTPAMIGGTRGDWKEYEYNYVVQLIYERAGQPDLAAIQTDSGKARDAFYSARPECLSILTIFLMGNSDPYLQRLRDEIEALGPLSEAQAAQGQLPSGQIAFRDPGAQWEVLAAPHQAVFARAISLRSNFRACGNLATLAKQAASHIDRLTEVRLAKGSHVGNKVFIGHGHSLVWRALKDFIEDDLGLKCDEFNAVEVAGRATVARLEEMLGESNFAFLVLTAEDEKTDGTVSARENVIHEVGLFQGRYGFQRAIVMLEEGCHEFSNIHGLGQLRFEPGKVENTFERVRKVLKREGIIT